MDRLVFGILAHVDSGKTTLSEAILYKSGVLRRPGRVDHGDAYLDTHSIERDRGITIFSKQARFNLGDREYTLLDTPGHVDFSMETERTLQVLDYAILVVSGSDGVQSHTETLWILLEKYNIPTFIFVNKMDLIGADWESLLNEIKSELSDNCVRMESPMSQELMESIAVCDDDILDKFLETGKIEEGNIISAIAGRKIFPCFFGSALKLEGVDELLRAFGRYTATSDYGSDFGARVFKISEDSRGGRMTHMKITGGALKVKSLISGTDRNQNQWSEKVNQIRIYSGEKYETADEAEAGTVCQVLGLSGTYPGQGLGAESDGEKTVLNPVLSYRVRILDNTDVHTALTKLRILEEEEPRFCIVWNEQLREINMQLMGEIQLEVLKRVVHDRFNMEIEFERGSVAYKETIKNTVEGVGHYEPLRHYAEVHLLLEPGKPGSGIKIAAKCSEDKLDKNWQRLILTHLREKNHVGVLTGSPITDIKITLVSGRAHKKHTEGGDFRQATYRAVRQGLRSAESVLLEPWFEIRLEVPAEFTSRAMTDIQKMGGDIGQPKTDNNNKTVISGAVPVSAVIDYQTEVTAYTSGRGKLSCIPSGYRPCADPEKVIEEIGYDCDADVENTADSVFCSHGSGFIVKWNEVEEHMHLESELKSEPVPVRQSSVREYMGRLSSDKELMQIFERTYGKIKREPYNAMYTKKSSVPAAAKPRGVAKVKTDRPEYLLVDGYNIIFAWDNLREQAEENLDMARVTLQNILCNYQGFKQCEIIVVFDAYKVKNNPGEVEKYNNITVVYTKEKETADTYIEKATHKLSKNNNVRVATSDFMEQLIILGSGALRMSAQELKDEVEAVDRAIKEYIEVNDPEALVTLQIEGETRKDN